MFHRFTWCHRVLPGSVCGTRSTPSASNWPSKTTSCRRQRVRSPRPQTREQLRTAAWLRPAGMSPSSCLGGRGGRRRSGFSASWPPPGSNWIHGKFQDRRHPRVVSGTAKFCMNEPKQSQYRDTNEIQTASQKLKSLLVCCLIFALTHSSDVPQSQEQPQQPG